MNLDQIKNAVREEISKRAAEGGSRSPIPSAQQYHFNHLVVEFIHTLAEVVDDKLEQVGNVFDALDGVLESLVEGLESVQESVEDLKADTEEDLYDIEADVSELEARVQSLEHTSRLNNLTVDVNIDTMRALLDRIELLEAKATPGVEVIIHGSRAVGFGTPIVIDGGRAKPDLGKGRILPDVRR